MKLETENAGSVRDPSEADIVNKLSKLDGYAILSQDELTYIQTSGTLAEGFVLEYQEGDAAKHFAVRERLSMEQVTAAFIAYAKNEPTWRTAFPWEKQDLGGKAGCLGVLAVGAATLAATWIAA